MKTTSANRATSRCFTAITTIAATLCTSLLVTANAQNASSDAIAEMLREGGYVLIMRHASSPREAPNPRMMSPGNVNRERELDEMGRATATAMGYAFRQLEIPIGKVLSSPTYRARETVEFMSYELEVADELAPGSDHADWLRERAAEKPEAGTNTLIVTHAPNISSAFGDRASNMEDGETLIMDPRNGARVLGRMPIREWAVLAVGDAGS